MPSNKNHFILMLTLSFLLLFLHSEDSQAQNQPGVEGFDGNYRHLFTEAESYLLYEDYTEALYLYQLLKREFANNKKYDYRIGLCYLHMMGRKDRAIPYLTRAAEAVFNNCREHLFRESCVPIDVYFYLGDAYRINNQLDEAISMYKKFLELADENAYDLRIVEQEIEACKRASTSKQQPIPVKFIPIEEAFNDGDNFNPVFSADGNTMVYASRLQFYTAIFYTTKNENGTWNTAQNIIPQLQIDDKLFPSSLNYDGSELYLHRLDDYGGNIYFSKLEDGRFTDAKKLPAPINSRFWESHASISPDGQTIYFSSNRNGGYGGLDIYTSTRTQEGWSEPENLGSTINTPLDEQTPFISPDNKTLYFSSQGHTSIGGFDIFKTERTNTGWTSPTNLGYPINTTDDDLFFHPFSKIGSVTIGYISRLNPSKGVQRNIYRVEF